MRGAINGPITEESLSGVTALRFSALPEDLSGLALIQNLKRIELGQDAVVSDAERVLTLSDAYEIVLIGGGLSNEGSYLIDPINAKMKDLKVFFSFIIL